MNAQIDRPVVIVLAAGRGERFRAAGGTSGKLDALLAGRPVLDHVLQAVQDSGLPYHVVRPQHLKDAARDGMGDSIAAGVAATANASGWLMLPGDLPLIQASTLRRMADALMTLPADAHTVAPQVQGQRAHPVGFRRACQPLLLALHGDEGARRLLRQYPPRIIDIEDEGAVWDVDTPDRLTEAEARWLQRQAR